MGAKCNITKSVLNGVYALRWGLNMPDKTMSIIQNYAEYLACPTVFVSTCEDDSNCVSIVTVFNCEFNVISMTFSVEDGQPYFNINVGNYVGGTAPFTYNWVFDEDNFVAVGPTNTDTLILTVKPDKAFEVLVTPITVTISDANGCEDTKICYVTPDGLRCSNSYEPCVNPSALEIVNTFIQCSGPSGLIINKA